MRAMGGGNLACFGILYGHEMYVRIPQGIGKVLLSRVLWPAMLPVRPKRIMPDRICAGAGRGFKKRQSMTAIVPRVCGGYGPVSGRDMRRAMLGSEYQARYRIGPMDRAICRSCPRREQGRWGGNMRSPPDGPRKMREEFSGLTPAEYSPLPFCRADPVQRHS
jgi:hypothetical protein